MIAYFDSSSIVKWFFDEPFMEPARDLKRDAEVAFTSPISYPEVMSAFNRAWREDRCSQTDIELVKSEFMRIWANLQWIEVSETLVAQAGQLIFRHGLRGFDAIHLSSALVLKEEGDGIEIFFSCFDKNLNRAAMNEGLSIHPEQ